MARGKGTPIPGLKRKPKREGGRFDDLTPEQQRIARSYLGRWLDKRRRHGQKLKRWEYPLLVGQARRLAKNPPTSAWGRSMRVKKGGYAVQEQYRLEGRDPTAKAAYVRQVRQGKPATLRQIYPGQQPYPSHGDVRQATSESPSRVHWPSETDWEPIPSNTTDPFKPMSGDDFKRFLRG